MNTRTLLTCALALVTTPAIADKDRSPEAQLAKAIAGRVAGEPVHCINQRDIRSTRVIDKTAIIYEVAGGTIYVNTPKSGAAFLRDDAILVTDTHSHQLCNIDIVKLMEPGSRMLAGGVGLGNFVPYRKVREEK
ncbi:hypothetical protein [Tahibacter amnicola]|uniref:Uncharacterized protein n=1 Tax=Tahibacter amnicola TaxID=2976241 RepID=A0ABY6BKR6_9GAMM|nr:hypothetical protein [Tahibacter amnicola]UXI70367.1 hypothetical protein N4264_12255 [Tahibacter amnicola]